MSTNGHVQTCRCSLHSQVDARRKLIDARRHECYRQLALAILGPEAPADDRGLVRALAEHARYLAVANSVPTVRARAA